jgi:tetratricopeptide (TPR) repeat protein
MSTSTQLAERIAQFRKMAQDDSENELGHFRLGQLLMEDGQHEEAARSFQRTLVLSPQFSKVYQLLAECQVKLDRRDEAVATLKEGYRIADQRGDKMPRDAMAQMMRELGVEVPEEKKVGGPRTGFPCQRPGCVAVGEAVPLPAPPVPDEIGQVIHERICTDCWNDWFRNYSIKVINELRLDLSTEQGQAEYDKYMRGFFGLE